VCVCVWLFIDVYRLLIHLYNQSFVWACQRLAAVLGCTLTELARAGCANLAPPPRTRTGTRKLQMPNFGLNDRIVYRNQHTLHTCNSLQRRQRWKLWVSSKREGVS
jgi:hypothetical protein